MIEELRLKDIEEAAKVYNKGLQMEVPKGYAALDETIKHLKEVHTFIYKEDGKIKGLVSFKFKEKDKIKINFICAIELRKGIGKKLMKKLVDFSLRNKVKLVYSNVSSKDKRVMNFYENCGFRKYGKYYENKDFMLYKIRAKPEWIKEAVKRKTFCMKSELKFIIENLNPKLLGVKEIKIDSFKKLGIGEGNVNYLFRIGNKKFICRANINRRNPKKSEKEFKSLKKIEHLGISPKAFYLHKKDKKFPLGFIILEFIEGKAMRMKKRRYAKNEIRQLARLLGHLHSQKIKSMKKEGYQYSVKHSDEYINEINKYTKHKFNMVFKRLKSEVWKHIPKQEQHKFSIIHCDICSQNILETSKGLKLIDWESCCFSDPARDICTILIDLELKGRDLDLFMKEYFKIRKDKRILERAKVYAILYRYVYFLWEIVRSFEIINKELPKEYLKKTTAKQHINEAKTQFRKLSKLIKISKINIDVLFTGAKD